MGQNLDPVGRWFFLGLTRDSHAKDETLNIALRSLAKKAGIQLHGRLHWHCGRKLVMTTGAQLGISSWIVKRLVGKSIPKADDTYLYPDPKEGFLKVNSVLRLKPIAANGRFSDLEEDGKLVIEALWELLKPIVEKKHLEKMMQAGPKDTVGLVEIEPIPTDPKEGL